MNDAMVQQAMQGRMGTQAAREVTVLLEANAGPFEKEMQKASQSTNKLIDALERLHKATVGVFRFAGTAAIGLGATMQATAAGAIASAASFEEAFARVAKTTGLQNTILGRPGRAADFFAGFGIGSDDLQRFENDIRGISTQIPVATRELSFLADVAGTLGVEAKNLPLFAETAAQLGAGINELGSDQAIAGLANLIGAFGLAETKVVNLGSSLAELSNHTRGNAAEMLQFSDRLSGVAVQVGMTAEEVLGLGAAVSAIGVRPELGASAIIQVITVINRALQQGGAEAEKFAKTMNMSLEELQSMWDQEGATSVVMRLIRTLRDQGDEAAVTLQRLRLSGVGATQVLGGLAAQYGELERAMQLSNDASKEGTAVQELAAIRFDTVIQRLRLMRQAMSEVTRSMGIGFLSVIKTMVDGVTNLVNIFNKIPQPIKTTMGLFAGLGGAALIAIGSFTLLFAKFHAILLLVDLLPALLKKMHAAFIAMGTGGAAAATRIGLLIDQLARAQAVFALMLTRVTALGTFIKGAMVAAWAALQRAIAGVVAAATLGTIQLTKLSRAYATFELQHYIHTMGLAGKAILKFAQSVGKAGLALVKKAGPLIALFAAFKVGQWIWRRAREDVENYTSSLEAAAEATDLLWGASAQLAKIPSALKDDLTISMDQSQLLGVLDRMDEARRSPFLFMYGAQLLASGNDPEEVKAVIEALSRAAGTPIVFDIEMDIRQGDALRRRIEGTAHSISSVISGIDVSLGARLFGAEGKIFDIGATPKSTVKLREELEGLMASFQDVGGINMPARLALFTEAYADLHEELRKGNIDYSHYQEAVETLSDVLFEGVKGSSLPWGDTEPLRVLANFFKDERPIEGWDELRAAVVGVVGETDNLSRAIMRMSPEQVRQLGEAFANMSVEAQEAWLQATLARDNFESDLGQFIATQTLGLSDQEVSIFMNNLKEIYPQMVGLEKAISHAQQELELFLGTTREWSPEAQRLRDLIKGWTDDLSQMKTSEIQVKIQDMDALSRLRHLEGELRNLTGTPWEATVRVEIHQMMRQELANEQQMFRGVMGQYQGLLDQRASAIESHNEQLGRMEEQRAKSVKDAHANHRKALQKLNEDEKKALEKRAEDQAKAFDIMQRIQARPSAAVGSLLHNMEAQNRAMEEMTSSVNQLQSMGLRDDVAKAMGFDDPQNFAQARRLLQAALSDPGMIDQINALWARRLDLSKAFVDESGLDEVKQQFADRRRDMEEQLKETIQNINERHADSVRDAGRNHQRAMETISRNMKKLGRETVETLEELYEKAHASGLENLMSLADSVKSIQEKYEDLIKGGRRNLRVEMAAEKDAQFDRAIDGMSREITDRVGMEMHGGILFGLHGASNDPRAKDSLTRIAENAGLDEIFRNAIYDGMTDGFNDWTKEQKLLSRDGAKPQPTKEQKLLTSDGAKQGEPSSGMSFVLIKDQFANTFMSAGGLLSGHGDRDTIPAMLTPGEYVIPKDAVQRYGIDFFDSIKAQKYATGGLVSRGREPMRPDSVSSLVQALRSMNMAGGETNHYGPISVEASDVNTLLDQLESKRRLTRLTRGGDPLV